MFYAPCPCGRTPTDMDIGSQNDFGWVECRPSCCGEWAFTVSADHVDTAARNQALRLADDGELDFEVREVGATEIDDIACLGD